MCVGKRFKSMEDSIKVVGNEKRMKAVSSWCVISWKNKTLKVN